MLAFGTEVQVTGKRHDVAAFPTAILFAPRPTSGGNIRYRAIFRAADGKNVEMNLYSDEIGNVVAQHSEAGTTAFILRCRGQWK